METWQIVFIMYGGVLRWQTLTSIQHGKKLAVIEKVLDGLTQKMDLFLKTEIDALKEIAKNKG